MPFLLKNGTLAQGEDNNGIFKNEERSSCWITHAFLSSHCSGLF
ncbi:hypothetical protein ECP030186713_5306 [Escherichia coli P0301867.13]|nr:hypothetical protein ECP030186713_5306 [Escherichia coli P0301867.13]